MRYLLVGVALCGFFAGASLCVAWDGFDADTTDLVEILPDEIPDPGSTIDVRVYDTNETLTCLVDSVTLNRRTIEVVVRTPDGKRKTLVMESK